jgi:hypothetical protein
MWAIVAIVGIPKIDTINVVSMPKPTVALILEMEKILTTTSSANFFNFPKNFPLKKICSKLPII